MKSVIFSCRFLANVLVFALFFLSHSTHAAQTIVAVAANFTEPAKEIAEIFKQKTGHEAELSFGATGNFYNQIRENAPFEVFFAADSARPQLAIDEGFGVEGSNFTYAIGTLVLWSADEGLMKEENVLFNRERVRHIAHANPQAAPYGKAAIEALKNLGLYEKLKDILVEGQNIAQAFQFVKTGNAEIGFVALSQVINEGGAILVVAQEHYSPIKQDAVLLKAGEENEAARAFLDFLKSEEALQIIKKYGYRTEQ